jgi:hypothetical protein
MLLEKVLLSWLVSKMGTLLLLSAAATFLKPTAFEKAEEGAGPGVLFFYCCSLKKTGASN